jgi:putative peptide zinc metalloprotease protein
LDGRHTFKDLTLEYHRQWKSLAPEAIAATVQELAKAGFVEGYGLRPDVQASMAPRPWLDRAVAAARRVLECYLVVKHADGVFERLYRWGGFLLFTRPCQAGLLLLNVLGLVAFFLGAGRVAPFLHDPIRSGALPLFLIPACVAALALHEAGHGLTTKHYGRRVRSAGIGWYWFGIVAFVDTTDMWGTDRRARIAVSVAGPYTNLLLAATAGFIAWCSPSLVVSATLWQFALVNYLNALINLNPLLEYDGFYILSDLMDRPNLRRECLGWLGQRLPAAIRNPAELRRHWFELLYGVCSLCFVAAMAGAFVVAYRVVLQSYLQTLLPPTVARGLPWVMVAALLLATAILSVSEMGRSEEHTSELQSLS